MANRVDFKRPARAALRQAGGGAAAWPARAGPVPAKSMTQIIDFAARWKSHFHLARSDKSGRDLFKACPEKYRPPARLFGPGVNAAGLPGDMPAALGPLCRQTSAGGAFAATRNRRSANPESMPPAGRKNDACQGKPAISAPLPDALGPRPQDARSSGINPAL